jgi:transposase InsO family protein
MHDDGIVARKRKTYKKPVSKQRQTPVAENILNREFKVTEQNSVWASDVSYFWTRAGWVHLAVVMDLYSRKIIGWSMSRRVNKELSINALNMALDRRGSNRPKIHHSDQGAEYSNKDYQSLLAKHNIKPSMRRKANCYDNAVVESFFKTVKSELNYRKQFTDVAEAKSAIFEYIEIFYNRNRLHSSLQYMSPVDYERLNSVN